MCKHCLEIDKLLEKPDVQLFLKIMDLRDRLIVEDKAREAS